MSAPYDDGADVGCLGCGGGKRQRAAQVAMLKRTHAVELQSKENDLRHKEQEIMRLQYCEKTKDTDIKRLQDNEKNKDDEIQRLRDKVKKKKNEIKRIRDSLKDKEAVEQQLAAEQKKGPLTRVGQFADNLIPDKFK